MRRDVASQRYSTTCAQAGPHSFTWNAIDDHGAALSSGVYMLSLTGHHSHASRKVVLLK
jgi:flagellar hook assembly protein FlgD